MKKTFYETLWSILEHQGVIDNWIEEGLLLKSRNTYSWSPKALQLVGLEASLGELKVTSEPQPVSPQPTKKKSLDDEIEWLKDFLVKFSVRNIGIAGKSGNVKAVTKKMNQFLIDYDYTKEEILSAVDLYIANLKKTGSMAYIQEAHYFVSKIIGSVQTSNLAKWCEEVRGGNSQQYTSHTIL